MIQTIQVSLWRGRARGRYQVYEVPLRENQTVLDVVTFVQRTLDPTLAYRFACRVGMCGSCAMTVNGHPRWTCRTHVANVIRHGRLKIGPLENLPVIKDLATDMRPFFEKWQQAKGAFVPSRTRDDPIARIAPGGEARRAADAAIECRISGAGGAQPCLVTAERRTRCRQSGEASGSRCFRRLSFLPLAPVLP